MAASIHNNLLGVSRKRNYEEIWQANSYYFDEIGLLTGTVRLGGVKNSEKPFNSLGFILCVVQKQTLAPVTQVHSRYLLWKWTFNK